MEFQAFISSIPHDALFYAAIFLLFAFIVAACMARSFSIKASDAQFEYEARQLEFEHTVHGLQSFHDEYCVIPDAEKEAERIIKLAKTQAAEIERNATKAAAELMEIAEKNTQAEKRKLENAKLEREDLVRKTKSECEDMVREARGSVAGILISAGQQLSATSETSRLFSEPPPTKKAVRVSLKKMTVNEIMLPMNSSNFVAFDLETTGLSPDTDEIIEIGAVKYEAGNLVDRFSSLVKPSKPIPAGATRINHITNEMVKDAPPLNLVMDQFLAFVGDKHIVAHNANFDIGFLKTALTGLQKSANLRYGDTLALARRVYKDVSNHKLGTICGEIGHDNTEAHRALGDALAVGEIIRDCVGKV